MPYRIFLAATLSAGIVSVALPSVQAHDVQFTNDVGATLHIEPNDIPLANAPTEVWFALTQAGGTVIPLENCDCRLTLQDAQDEVLATPTLTPVSAEGYRDIPGAVVLFPEVGAYELVLAGEPSNGEDFSPFELRFEVTVARAAQTDTASAETAPAAEPTPESADTNDAENGATIADTSTDSADAATNSTTEPMTETSEGTSASRAWYLPLIWGGAILIAGLVWRVLHNSQSPGDES